MALRVLFIGEIVGRAGVYCIKSALKRVRKEHEIDFVIANGDGATGGFGLGKNHAVYLRKLGVDVLTSGDQIYFKKDMVPHIDKAPYILRPANFPPHNPGRGWRYYTIGSKKRRSDGPVAAEESANADAVEATDAAGAELVTAAESGGSAESGNAQGTPARAASPAEASGFAGPRLAVINFLGQSGFNRVHLSNPYTYLPELVQRIKQETPVIIVDYHAVTTAEKATMFFHADGLVSAVIGTGTRVMTADASVLPKGTAVISDAGRTGSLDSVGGLDPAIEIQKFLTQVPERSKDAWDNLELQGVIIDIDESGKATSIVPLRVPCEGPDQSERESQDNRRPR